MKLQKLDDVMWTLPCGHTRAEWARFTMEYFMVTHVPYNNRVHIGARPWEYWAVLRHIHFEPDDVVVDLGSFRTYVAVYIAHRGAGRVIALDNADWAQVAKAPGLYSFEEWEEELKKYGMPAVEVEHADMRTLPFESNSCDVLISFSTLEHIEAPGDTEASAEAYRVLKPGGVFAGTVDFGARPAAFPGNDVYDCDTFEERIVRPVGWEYIVQIPPITPGPGRSALVFLLRR